MKLVKATLDLLGRPAECRVTQFKGVITSVNFDLYGCVQACVSPPVKEGDGKLEHGHWFDVSRLHVSRERVMTPPDFASQTVKPLAYDKGPADKPPLSI